MVLRARVGKEVWVLVIIAKLRNTAAVTFGLPICLVFEGMKDREKIKKPRHMYNASICYCIFVE
jgi:hypothetical protein